MDLSPIHDCKWRRWWEENGKRRRQAVFSGWSRLEANLPAGIFRWLTRLSEIGPAAEVGVGEMHKIREFGVACWRAGVADGRESDTLRTRTKGRKKP